MKDPSVRSRCLPPVYQARPSTFLHAVNDFSNSRHPLVFPQWIEGCRFYILPALHHVAIASKRRLFRYYVLPELNVTTRWKLWEVTRLFFKINILIFHPALFQQRTVIALARSCHPWWLIHSVPRRTSSEWLKRPLKTWISWVTRDLSMWWR